MVGTPSLKQRRSVSKAGRMSIAKAFLSVTISYW